MSKRIIPLNLPAGLDREIPGNPVSSRLETVPANCYPGLDIDVRNLDRRFFPGILFDFVCATDADPMTFRRGAQIVGVDSSDPDLAEKEGEIGKENAEVKKQLDALNAMLPTTTILLDSIEDKDGNKIKLSDGKSALDGLLTWRVVRSLEPGRLTIGLAKYDGVKRTFLMKLTGRRRTYQHKNGEISTVYEPGELTQSLCSPWQHDFRGCACSYWASNHPDIVLPAHPSDIAEVDDAGQLADRAQDPIIWMRWETDKPVAPRKTGDACRALEMDTYEMNSRWKELAIVLEGREQLAPWSLWMPIDPPGMAVADVIPRLEELAGMEMTVALEYLYARYTVRFYEPLEGEFENHAAFISHELLNVAVSEMMHLHWVNLLLKKLRLLTGVTGSPILKPGGVVPSGTTHGDDGRNPIYVVTPRKAEERPLDKAIEDFLAAEAPSGTIEGQYARILLRLKKGFPKDGDACPELITLVERIISDGVEHYSRFREMREMLQRPGGKVLIADDLVPVKDGSAKFEEAKELYQVVVDKLMKSYHQSEEDARKTAGESYEAMKKLDEFAVKMAQQRKAIPFLEIAKQVTPKL